MSFVHIFQAQAQDNNAVTAIMNNVVSRLKHIVPELHTVYFRQDNAGCYHCTTTLLSVKKITQETGIAIREIDFCDLQGGKRVCDRKAATIKGQMRIYGNEGHNIEDATQMKTAIESSNRLSDLVTVVGSVPPRIDNGENTWQGVSLLNNFEITDAEVRVWRAYGIGTGKLLKSENLSSLPSHNTVTCIDFFTFFFT